MNIIKNNISIKFGAGVYFHILSGKKETHLVMHAEAKIRVLFYCNMSTATATTTSKEGIFLFLSLNMR